MLRFLFLVWFFAAPTLHAADPVKAKPKKIVLIAGKKSHGPVGNGIHDYGWSVKLLKVMLDNCELKDRLEVEVHLEGWPRDPKTLTTADCIMIVSDGRDGDLYEEAPHLASEERVRFVGEQMKRGCGFLTFHFSTFAPEKYRDEMLDWCGGYFQWETDGKKKWYSAITTVDTALSLPTKTHPILRGVRPFKMREEFYYNLRFKPKDDSLQTLLQVPALKGREPDGQIVAWCRERPDGGRGFGTTCGHFYDNWKNPDFRKFMLNALLWCSKIEVPEAGITSRFYTHAEIDAALRDVKGTEKATFDDRPLKVLLFAGNDAHRWHNWERTTPAMIALLEEAHIKVDVSLDIEDLGKKKLTEYSAILLNYCNWHDPKALSEPSRKAFTDFLKKGGGLVVVHFANGAFHFSLPKAKESDWPEYRKIVRRVWNHEGKGKEQSGHDAFGGFKVEIANRPHPITEGLKPFDVTDELYFNQAGEEGIEPLITARSKVTKADEPLAWVAQYGEGRIFQTLLGHSEKTYETFEPREMLRRAVMWTARRSVVYRESDTGKK